MLNINMDAHSHAGPQARTQANGDADRRKQAHTKEHACRHTCKPWHENPDDLGTIA